MKLTLAIASLLLAASAQAQTVTYEVKDNVTGVTVAGSVRHTTQARCDAAIAALRDGKEYTCRRITRAPAPPVQQVCAPAPAASVTTTSQACPAGQTGGPIVTTTTTPYTRGAYPGCAAVEGVRTTVVTGACVPIVVTPPPPPPVGASLHFSPANCSNANPGTVERPKCDLAGVNINTLPTPIALRFAGGHTWAITRTIRLMNPNVSAANPLVFESYGTGQATLRFAGVGQAVEWGEWGNGPSWTTYAGYTFRNITFDGGGSVLRGLWLRGGTDAVLVDGATITGFHIGIDCQGAQAVRGLTVRHSRIVRNNSMGVLGSCSESTFENNLIAENNFGGSNRDHGMYLSGVRNTAVRGNQFVNNSVVNGRCTGGNLTVHGQVDGLTVEGNRFVIPDPDFGCWPISLTAMYSTPEWFRNTVVRNNVITNFPFASIVYSSAPGIVVDGNTICKPGTGTETGITREAPGAGDDPGGNEVIRNNVRRSGADATTGVCAP